MNGGRPGGAPGLQIEAVIADHDQAARSGAPAPGQQEDPVGVRLGQRLVPPQHVTLGDVVRKADAPEGAQRVGPRVAGQHPHPDAASEKLPQQPPGTFRRFRPPRQFFLYLNQPLPHEPRPCRGERVQMLQDIPALRNAQSLPDAGKIMNGNRQGPVQIKNPVSPAEYVQPCPTFVHSSLVTDNGPNGNSLAPWPASRGGSTVQIGNYRLCSGCAQTDSRSRRIS